jgi:tetratricopeptide (TPR) repeat protein|tara:strand:+ start:1953 stop:2714 length:762 start_codon:yes stop_codon:yes gene_type:complete
MKKVLYLFLLTSFISCNTSVSLEKSKELVRTGIAKERAKDYFGAIADYTKAIELNPNNVSAYGNRGNSKINLKDYSGAMLDFNKCIELKPNNSNSYGNRGVLKSKLKDYYGAIEDYSKAIELDPREGIWYSNMGLLRDLLKDYDIAIICFSKAIELRLLESDVPHNLKNGWHKPLTFNNISAQIDALAKNYHYRSMTYEQLGKTYEACKDLKEIQREYAANYRLQFEGPRTIIDNQWKVGPQNLEKRINKLCN